MLINGIVGGFASWAFQLRQWRLKMRCLRDQTCTVLKHSNIAYFGTIRHFAMQSVLGRTCHSCQYYSVMYILQRYIKIRIFWPCNKQVRSARGSCQTSANTEIHDSYFISFHGAHGSICDFIPPSYLHRLWCQFLQVSPVDATLRNWQVGRQSRHRSLQKVETWISSTVRQANCRPGIILRRTKYFQLYRCIYYGNYLLRQVGPALYIHMSTSHRTILSLAACQVSRNLVDGN